MVPALPLVILKWLALGETEVYNLITSSVILVSGGDQVSPTTTLTLTVVLLSQVPGSALIHDELFNGG